MHCAQARNLVALLVGDDICEADRPEVERHVAECQSCQAYHSGLMKTQQLLTAGVESETKSPGLWADLQPQVQLASRNRSAKRFNGWAAALAVAATVMAMFAISSDMTPVNYADEGSQFQPQAAPVSFGETEFRQSIRSGEIDRQEAERLRDLSNQTF